MKAKISEYIQKYFGILNMEFRSILVLILCTSFLSCKNDTDKICSLETSTNEPEQIVKSSVMLHSENGRVKMKVESPLTYSFVQGENQRVEYPKGVFITFLNPDKSTQATLKADSAVSNSLTKIMEARKNVIIINYEKHDTIYTEEIIWDQNAKKIYSQTAIKQISPTHVTYGDGFESDESIRNYRIIKQRGTVEWDEKQDTAITE